jgi:hypothetical protein
MMNSWCPDGWNMSWKGFLKEIDGVRKEKERFS